jgi:hypothetical protein
MVSDVVGLETAPDRNNMKSSIIWDMTPRSPLKVKAKLCLLSASYWFLAWLTIQSSNPEDGDDIFL